MDANSSKQRDGLPMYLNGHETVFWCDGCTPDNCRGCPPREKPEPELPFDLQYALDKAIMELHKAQEALREASSAADRWREQYWAKKWNIVIGQKLLITQTLRYSKPIFQSIELRITDIYPDGEGVGTVDVEGVFRTVLASEIAEARQAYLDLYGEGEK